MSPVKIPQITASPADEPVDLEKFIHGSDVPESLSEAFDRARRALAVATDFDEVKGIRDQAETLRAHAKRVKWSLDVQNQCAEIKIRAERKAGAILGTFTVKGGERHKLPDATYERRGLLDDVGVSKFQSSRWQTISRMPEDAFEAYLRTAEDPGVELTQAGVLRLAARLEKRDLDEDQVAQQRGQKIVKTLTFLRRDLERIQEENWHCVSKEVVKELLADLLSLCE